MDRRTLLKSSGLLVGAVAFHRLTNAAPVTTPLAQAANSGAFVISDKQPLLLNYNENSLGMAPSARQAVSASLSAAFRYPDDAREALMEAVAKADKVSMKHVTLGNGSSEIIQMAVQAFALREAQLVCPDPTFNYAELYAKPLGTKITKVPLNAQMGFDLAKMRAATEQFAGPSVVYLCNPNNPTATITPAKDIEAWIKSAPPRVFFIVDEAYHDYATDSRYRSAIPLVQAGLKNLVVARTFSKVYALAGLRIGYGVAHPEVIAKLDEFASIDNTNIAAAAAATASLNDKAFIQTSLASTNKSRDIVTKVLNELKLEYLPSQANFIFHRVKGDTATYRDRMKARHVMVGRPFDHTDGWNRLTLGTPQEMEAFVAVLRDFRKQGWV